MADQRPIGFWLRLVDNRIDEQFATTLDEHGVTRLQWQLMNVLARGAASVEMFTTAVQPFVATSGEEAALEQLSELIESGWVNATPSGYELSERGHGALDRLTNVVAGQRTGMTEGVTAGDYATTVATLERLARNLGWTDEG